MAEIMVPALGFGARAPPGRDLDDGLCDGHERVLGTVLGLVKFANLEHMSPNKGTHVSFKERDRKTRHEKYLGTLIAKCHEKLTYIIAIPILPHVGEPSAPHYTIIGKRPESDRNRLSILNPEPLTDFDFRPPRTYLLTATKYFY
jgi:hypothetical protein